MLLSTVLNNQQSHRLLFFLIHSFLFFSLIHSFINSILLPHQWVVTVVFTPRHFNKWTVSIYITIKTHWINTSGDTTISALDSRKLFFTPLICSYFSSSFFNLKNWSILFTSLSTNYNVTNCLYSRLSNSILVLISTEEKSGKGHKKESHSIDDIWFLQFEENNCCGFLLLSSLHSHILSIHLRWTLRQSVTEITPSCPRPTWRKPYRTIDFMTSKYVHSWMLMLSGMLKYLSTQHWLKCQEWLVPLLPNREARLILRAIAQRR